MKVSVIKFQLMCEAAEWLLNNSGYDLVDQDAEWHAIAYKHCRKQVYIIANEHLSINLLNDTMLESQIDTIFKILRGEINYECSN